MLSNFPALPGMTAPVNRPAAKLRARGRQGFALVVVLAVILMLSVLIVGLLIMAENETKTAARYMDAADARLAADSVVQIVEGQIKQATLSGIDADGKGTQAWASQPGAIRVFNNSGGLVNIFKLYSSDSMVVNTPDSLFTDVPANWQDTPDAFVDLNAPISRNGQWIYPVASPDALPGGPNPVAGFDTTRAQSTVAWDDRLAMPARWIYIQKDGSMSTDPTVGDPVVRVAYWTDDESSKININTASATDANSYADMPRANTADEREYMAWRQPSQNEFNRYPGHPATVSLTTVFPGSTIQDLIGATPRYAWGGSQNAAKRLLDSRTPLSNPPATRRLYTTPDEFLYTPDRAEQLALKAPTLDPRRFFLTTTSRSSELNLFGQPRVTIWPISGVNDDYHRTPYDQFIAHCSTIGEGSAAAKPYFFQRSNPLDQEADWLNYSRNQELFKYLQNVTGDDNRKIPGFGGNFLTKYDSSSGGVSGERDQILTEIFDYIRCVNLNETNKDQDPNFVPFTRKLTDLASPSGATFLAARGGGFVLPILITSINGVTVTGAPRGAGRVPVVSEVGFWLIQTLGKDTSTGLYNVVPDPPEIQPAMIIETFSPMQGYMPWVPNNFSYSLQNSSSIIANGVSRPLQSGTTVNFQYGAAGGTVSQGQQMGGLDGFGWLFSLGFQTGLPNNMNPTSNPKRSPFLTQKADAIKLTGHDTSVQISPGSLTIAFRCDPSSADLSGSTSGTVFQTYTINVPSISSLPVPTPLAPTGAAIPQTGDIGFVGGNGWWTRCDNVSGANTPPHFLAGDVARGIGSVDGDYRTVAYLQDVPAGFFSAPTNFDSSTPLVHGFRGGSQNHAFLGTTNGGYVGGVTYGSAPAAGSTLDPRFWISAKPKISGTISDLRGMGWEGDFDNGVAHMADGPYLNKSDEGGKPDAPHPGSIPYFYWSWSIAGGFFSPERQMPSAVMFGSLPTSVIRNYNAYKGGVPGNARPWRTLNFCANPLAGSAHFGISGTPNDELLLDLFNMPVVEPYAISEPFSSAGRLNMNYQIVPFTHILRKTAMHAALAAQKVIAIANSDASTYKTQTTNTQVRYAVNIPETLTQFDKRFATDKDVFRSASEICSIFLIPTGSTYAGRDAFWTAHQLTGNNSRERPYATLYPLLTTKSNVFTTHIRAQAIKRLPSGKINVNSEYRGSVTFERYLDPNDPVFTNGTVDPDKVSLEPYFRFRTLEAKQFDL